MRNENLWLTSDLSVIVKKGRAASTSQLEFIDILTVKIDAFDDLVVCCFYHDSYPYDSQRWDQWRCFFSANLLC